jgi:hypothetical protein
VDKWVLCLIIGVVALIIGFGMVKGFKFKSAEAELQPSVIGGAVITFVGIVVTVIGILGLVGVIGVEKSVGQAREGGTPTVSTASGTLDPSSSTEPSDPDQGELKVTIERPADRARVPYSGTILSGDVDGDLKDLELWLFIYSDKRWYLTDSVSVSDTGFFQINTGQIGLRSEKDEAFTFEILASSPSQSTTIRNKRPNRDGDIVFDKRPGKKMAARVVIRE